MEHVKNWSSISFSSWLSTVAALLCISIFKATCIYLLLVSKLCDLTAYYNILQYKILQNWAATKLQLQYQCRGANISQCRHLVNQNDPNISTKMKYFCLIVISINQENWQNQKCISCTKQHISSWNKVIQELIC